jgi:type IV secretion system protein VirB5
MRAHLATLSGLLLSVAAPLAHAQFAVIDVASVAQLISEVQTLQQQVQTAQAQLSQAQAEFKAITGDRGMEQLLGGINRNYLPSDPAALQAAAQGAGAFPALAASVRGASANESVLSAPQLATLAPAAAAQLQSQRQSAALLQGLTQQALANTSARFAGLQQLIKAIGTASDQKGALDLQARIAAEGGMLQNERTKLEVLFQGAYAEAQMGAQHARELVIAGHGQFDGRFQPHP